MFRWFSYAGLLSAGLLVAACSDSGVPTSSTFTLHYHRSGPAAAATYEGWTVELTGDVDETSVSVSDVDDFGAVFEVPLPVGATSFTYRFTDGTATDPSAAVSVTVADAAGDEAWHWEGAEEARLTAPPAIPTSDQMLVYYRRCDGEYGTGDTQYGVYTWGSAAPLYTWPDRKFVDGIDDEFGAWYLIDLTAQSSGCPFGDFCFIVQAGGDSTKDPAVDRGLQISDSGNQLFLLTQDATVYTSKPECGDLSIAGARAHLVRQDTLAWNVGATDAASYELRYSPTAEIAVNGSSVTGGTAIPLTPTTLSQAIQSEKPHLASFSGFTLGDLTGTTIKNVLLGQVLAVAYNASGAPVEVTAVQMPGALDELYPYDGPLGLEFSTSTSTPTRVRVWAPTARDVRLEVYDASLAAVATVEMMRDDETGVWSRDLDAAWYGGYYRYEVTGYYPQTGAIETVSVTDPYSTSLSTNSLYTQIIDVMNDATTKPPGWDTLQKPPLGEPEDISIYELHVRDFSLADSLVPEADRGKFTAFLYNGTSGRALSEGMDHLIALGNAGLTHVHLLPAFDIATVDEDPNNRVEITDGFDRLCSVVPAVPAALCAQFGTMSIRDALATYGPADLDQQEIINYMRDLDGFNWGYDPFHYSAPEGSYSTNPMGSQRVLEFRQMVQALADVGLRNALDVVYNHTNAAGLGDKSVLDKIVPWYYHRLDALSGFVTTETCCQDTATENRMMEKLMIDSVVFWAKAYKLDAFRFDLMGYHLKSNMERLRAALDSLTVADDGIDGTKVYVYGEGWNPGSQGASRGENATQITLDNTGIGTFSDRLRDAARGGGPFDSGQQHVLTQGFINGLSYDPNDPAAFVPGATRNPNSDLGGARERADWIRVGLAGALRRYRLETRNDIVQPGSAVTYNGAIGGYTSDPEEVISYTEKHDNETLFDISNYKNPLDMTMADRVRVQNMGISLVALAQGVPFFHAGMDLLRSKSMDRNSFNSGDWFNTIDWTGATNNFKKGLPQQGDNAANQDQQALILNRANIAPEQSHVLAVAAHMREMLQIRSGSPLFRLQTEADIQSRVGFYATGSEQIPGLIAMGITDGTACPNTTDLDAAYDAVFVVFNANDEAQTVDVPSVSGFELHPVLAGSADATVQTASFAVDAGVGTFSVPGRTAAVFVIPQGDSQGAGLPCNPASE